MDKQIFKKGDRVFHVCNGWGVVTQSCDALTTVDFDDVVGGTVTETSILSFTEYTLQNFSQERPIGYNDYMGKWGMLGDKGTFCVGKLDAYDLAEEFPFEFSKTYFRNFKPLTEEQIKILELE